MSCFYRPYWPVILWGCSRNLTKAAKVQLGWSVHSTPLMSNVVKQKNVLGYFGDSNYQDANRIVVYLYPVLSTVLIISLGPFQYLTKRLSVKSQSIVCNHIMNDMIWCHITSHLLYDTQSHCSGVIGHETTVSGLCLTMLFYLTL